MSDNFSIIAKVGGIIIALTLVFAGVLMLRVEAVSGGLFLLLIGLVVFIFSSRALEKKPLANEHLAAIQPYRGLLISWSTSLGLVIWILYQQAQPETKAYNLRWNGVLWVVAIFLVVAGAFSADGWHWPERVEIRSWWHQHKTEIFWLALILIAGFVLRIYALSQHPYPWSGDEASVGIDGRRILTGDIQNLFATSWSSQPNISFIPTAISLAIFGETINAIRMVSVVVGTLTILTTYLLARELFDRQVALVAAIFLIAFPYHLQFSRIGVSNIFDGLNITLGLWFLYRAIKLQKVLDYALAGIIAGLSFYTYVGSRLVPIVLVGGIIYAALREREYLRRNFLKIGGFAFSVFITFAPMAAYFIQHPDNFMTRIGQEGILLNGWLTNQAEISGTNPLGILLSQFSKSTLVFISSSAHGNFFNSPDPYLTVLGAIFFLIGMASAFMRFKEIRYMLLLGWFWSVVLFGGILTSNPPASTRMVMSIPAIAIFLALGLQQVAECLNNLHVSAKLIKIFTVATLAILFFQGVFFYYGKYWSGFYFQDGNSELGMETGLQLHQLGPETNFYLFGRPRVFANFPTTAFLAPENQRVDLTSADIDTLFVPATESALFVAIPDNMADLMRVEERFPGGEWQVVERKTKPEVLYYAYILESVAYSRP
jgi:4-amino-4-deoxy-L-arabinose transferase-like glycosyltransferase